MMIAGISTLHLVDERPRWSSIVGDFLLFLDDDFERGVKRYLGDKYPNCKSKTRCGSSKHLHGTDEGKTKRTTQQTTDIQQQNWIQPSSQSSAAMTHTDSEYTHTQWSSRVYYLTPISFKKSFSNVSVIDSVLYYKKNFWTSLLILSY
jgi:hypothetical protein